MKNRAIINTTRHDTTRHDTTRHGTPLLSVIMPSIPADIGTLINNSEFFFRYLPIKNICVVGPASVSETVRSIRDSRFIFMNENEFCNIQRLREIYLSHTDVNPVRRVGWYVQQFIKIQFSRFTQDEYYLIWDSDTLPLKPAILFDSNGKPYFDMKTEYHPPYFETISRILPGITKAINKSFISEHMVIRREYMLEMIHEIESSSSLEGSDFQERIFNALGADKLSRPGFSEYETYGNFTLIRHPGSYIIHDWHSLRAGRQFWDNTGLISPEEIIWLATKYDAISIEKWQKPTKLARLAKSKTFRAIFLPTVLERLAKLKNKLSPRTFIARLRYIVHKIKSLLTKKA